jgi:predicted pyridoxine 5'-phosphate oxidase superfamily flavin-nucleotide-binding protein
MQTLDDEIRAFVAAQKLCFAATVCPDGTPNLSPKGSLQVWDERTLVFADIASPRTIANLRANPSIAINVLDPFARLGWRFKGRAHVRDEGAEYDAVRQVILERFGDLYPVRRAVVIDVESVLPLRSPTYQFDPSADEAVIRRQWMAIYGVRPVND